MLATSGSGRTTMYVINGIGYVPIHKWQRQDAIDTESAMRYQVRGSSVCVARQEACESLRPPPHSSRTRKRAQWRKTLDFASTYNGTRLIFGQVLAHHGYMPSQTPEALAAYNAWVRELAANHSDLGVEVFDGRALVEHAFSPDGVHYRSHDNVALAQVLLNVLAKGPQRARTRPANVSRARPGRWRDGPQRSYYEQDDVDPGAAWFLGRDFDLRGCRCFPQWRAMLEANATARVCHCRGWCPPHVTPAYLTHEHGACSIDMRSQDPTHTCKHECRGGVAQWGDTPCWRLGCPLPEDRCTNCKRS